jgi:NAD-dependent dihydropyrimidine dehydrogenase PreA subunit
MSTSNEIFDRLATMVGAPGSKRFARVLEAMMTPDEALILLELKDWTPAEAIAKKFNLSVEKLQSKLDDMEHRQIIRKNPMGYITPQNIVAFHHGSVGWLPEELHAKVYRLWGDFFFAEWRDILVDGFEKRKATGAPAGHRVIPAHKALMMSPKILPEQLLWYEDMDQVLKRSERISFMMCGCRGLWRKCDNPIETCLQVVYKTPGVRKEPPHYIKPPKDVSYEEAIASIHDFEDRGLVHIPLNTSTGDMYCSCCDDCCMVINPLLYRNKVHEILSPSRFRAVIDQNLCSGCQTCVGRCKFDAIEMQPVPGSKKMKAVINKEHCLGCGVCVITCKKNALTLELVRAPDHIPTVSVMHLLQRRS